jgi:hypothetical protein
VNPLSLPKWKSRAPSADAPKTPPSFGVGGDYDGDVVTGESMGRPKEQVPYISLKDEARRAAAKATHTITVQVLGGESVKMAWENGKSLGDYLGMVGLKGSALRRALYDLTNLTAGRLRLYYMPKPGAHIRLQKASIGVQFEHQTNRGRDIEEMARNMGATKGDPSPKFVDFNMTYAPTPKPKDEDEDEHGGVPQV